MYGLCNPVNTSIIISQSVSHSVSQYDLIKRSVSKLVSCDQIDSESESDQMDSESESDSDHQSSMIGSTSSQTLGRSSMKDFILGQWTLKDGMEDRARDGVRGGV